MRNHFGGRPLPLTLPLEFSRLESWSRDVSRPVFTSLGLGVSETWSWNTWVSVLGPWRLGLRHS